ncbi:unnamed protein product [Anisakis simplex]|uniref:Uncharacterized protein n=1 Tax=Anisakis simplex TaxID=6269 RepID=A0A0M3JVS4_ANISI|nr:unnamed protein product [Anisakis simplex]
MYVPRWLILFSDQATEILDMNGTFENITDDAFDNRILENNTMHTGTNGLEIDLMELLRVSSIVYIGMCVLWLLSLFMLLASIKLDNLELAVFNAIILCIVMIYAIIHALFISLLFFYLCECLASIVNIIKGGAHKRGNAQEYSIPEARRHSQMAYGDDGLVQQFSHF